MANKKGTPKNIKRMIVASNILFFTLNRMTDMDRASSVFHARLHSALRVSLQKIGIVEYKLLEALAKDIWDNPSDHELTMENHHVPYAVMLLTGLVSSKDLYAYTRLRSFSTDVVPDQKSRYIVASAVLKVSERIQKALDVKSPIDQLVIKKVKVKKARDKKSKTPLKETNKNINKYRKRRSKQVSSLLGGIIKQAKRKKVILNTMTLLAKYSIDYHVVENTTLDA